MGDPANGTGFDTFLIGKGSEMLCELEAHHVAECDVDIVALESEQLELRSRWRRSVGAVTDFISDPTARDSAGNVGDFFVREVGRASIEKRADLVLCICELYRHGSRDAQG